MEFREIESLSRLASTGSIQETAKQCHLTPGAIHKHLKSLESEFSVRLYEKNGDKLQLTHAGEVVLPYLREALAHTEAATSALADWKQSPRGLVRIGAGPAFSCHVLPHILTQFRTQFPEVRFFVETGHGDHLAKGLLDGSLDLTFDLRSAATLAPNLIIVASWEAPLGFFTGMLDLPSQAKLKDLACVPFILFETDSRINDIVQGYFDACHFSPPVVMRSVSAEAIKAMIAGGLGVGMLFLWAAQDELRRGQLRQITVVDVPPLISQMSLVMKRLPYVPLALNAFINSVKAMSWDSLTPVT